MEIKDFIEKALKDIMAATTAASDDKYVFVLANREGKGVFFDMALVVRESEDKGSGAEGKIKVANVVEVGGKIGKDASSTEENTSRIQFNIGYRDLNQEKENSEAARVFNAERDRDNSMN